MSSTQPSGVDRQLPRGHLLVLNRSFRRTLEAENKSPRTIEAYTDAVRLLASHSQAHGHPLLAGEVGLEVPQGPLDAQARDHAFEIPILRTRQRPGRPLVNDKINPAAGRRPDADVRGIRGLQLDSTREATHCRYGHGCPRYRCARRRSRPESRAISAVSVAASTGFGTSR